MPKLSYPIIRALSAKAMRYAGLFYNGPNCKRSTLYALRRKELIDFNCSTGDYFITAAGFQALADHGYKSDGTWLGSNQPRKYR